MRDVAVRLYRHRELLWSLTRRELAARYRGSALGFLWSLVNPLLLLGVYSLVFDVIFSARDWVHPYAVFLISGLFPWIFISTGLLDGTLSLSANAGLIKKAVFPAEVLPVVAVLSSFLHLVLALPIVAVAIAVSRLLGSPVGGTGVAALPLVCAVTLPAVAGGALALSVLQVHFKDVRDLLQNVLTLLFFLAPILYPLEGLGERLGEGWGGRAVLALIAVNPVSPFARAYQSALFWGDWPDARTWAAMVLIAAFCWWAGCFLFARLAETIGEAL